MNLTAKAVLFTAWRAGLRRVLYRVKRLIRLRLLNPCFADRIYTFPNLVSSPGQVYEICVRQRQALQTATELREMSGRNHEWVLGNNQLKLLNQPSIAFEPPVDWQNLATIDPLWVYHLHGWEWAWPHLFTTGHQEQILALWHDWVENVQVGRGLAWEPYPTSRRLIVWCAAWHLLNGDAKLAAAIAQHANYIQHHLERDLDNNHLIANAKALAWAGLLSPQLQGAGIWRSRGLDQLWRALRMQVRSDGGHVENAASYHLAVLLDAVETVALCLAVGEPVPADVLTLLKQMGDFAAALRRPDGRLPLMNDSIEDEPLPIEPLLAYAEQVLPNVTAGDWTATSALPSQVFKETGYAVYRSTSTKTFLWFDCGDLGPDYCPGHGHADTLSFELWANGAALIVDPGTYQYPAGPWRDYFRSTRAHSTVEVDGCDQSVFAGPFRLAHLAYGRLLGVEATGQGWQATGEHDGYRRLPDPVLHRRQIRIDGDHVVHLRDTLSGRNTHTAILRLHLTPSHVEIHSAQSASVCFAHGVRLDVQVNCNLGGALSVEEGWISRSWYQKEPSPVLAYAVAGRFPVDIYTELRIIS